MARRNPVPVYCHHKGTKQAYLTIRAKGEKPRILYLGLFGSPQSIDKYRSVVSALPGVTPAMVVTAVAAVRERLRQPRPDDHPPPKANHVTVLALYQQFSVWAVSYYRYPDGRPTEELRSFATAATAFCRQWGSELTESITRRHLLSYREKLVERGLARKTINGMVWRVQRVFRWGAEDDRGLVPDAIAAAVSLVRPLKPFRSAARETSPIQSVPLETVLAVVDANRTRNPVLVAILELLLLTGCRPGEVRTLRKSEVVAVEGGSWVIDKGRWHKTAWRGEKRVVPLTKEAVTVLQPFLAAARDDGYLFRAPRGKSVVCYSKRKLSGVMETACRQAGVPNFGLNRIRHLVATVVRSELGLDAAQALLGHTNNSTTEKRYAPVNTTIARLGVDAMARLTTARQQEPPHQT